MTRRSLFALLLAPVLWPVRKVLGRRAEVTWWRPNHAEDAHLCRWSQRCDPDSWDAEGRRLFGEEWDGGSLEYRSYPGLKYPLLTGQAKRRPRR